MPTRDELVKGAAKVTPEQAHSPSNPKVYFDIKIGDPHAGRVTFEVMTFSHQHVFRCYAINSSTVGVYWMEFNYVLLHVTRLQWRSRAGSSMVANDAAFPLCRPGRLFDLQYATSWRRHEQSLAPPYTAA